MPDHFIPELCEMDKFPRCRPIELCHPGHPDQKVHGGGGEGSSNNPHGITGDGSRTDLKASEAASTPLEHSNTAMSHSRRAKALENTSGDFGAQVMAHKDAAASHERAGRGLEPSTKAQKLSKFANKLDS